MFAHRRRPAPHVRGVRPAQSHRRGSVLLVVIGLLGILLLLGFMFFSFATYESNSAQAFSEAAKVLEPDIEDDALFNHALEQIILGSSLPQSALYGGRSGMLPNMLGTQISPYNGEGIHVALAGGTAGKVIPDQNHDGAVDTVPSGSGSAFPLDPAHSEDPLLLLRFNLSTAANSDLTTIDDANGNPRRNPLLGPSPGVDYTYPDINNVYLAYEAAVPTTLTGGKTAVIPSYHRWQYLYNYSTGAEILDWPSSTDADVGRRIMRPHKSHKIADTNIDRFPATKTGTLTTTFPFDDVDSTSANVDKKYDVDFDGDGTPEAIWMDLDYPVQELPDGRKYVPLFAVKILDLDALININAHGNLAAYLGQLNNTTTAFGGGYPVSRSNQALTPSEVNPFWALRDPMTATSFPAMDPNFKDYSNVFGANPRNRVEQANMDLLFMLWGRPIFTGSSMTDLITGRYGDRDRLSTGISAGTISSYHPEPGVAGADDDYDQYEGEYDRYATNDVFAFQHPLDFKGAGSMLLPRTDPSGGMGAPYDPYGRRARYAYYGTGGTLPAAANGDPSFHILYSGYQNRGSVSWGVNPVGKTWAGYLMLDQNGNITATNPTNQLLDHPAETVLDPDYLSLSDDTFGPEDNESFHKSDADSDQNLVHNRPRDVMPWSFQNDDSANGNAAAKARRKQFTATSWDRKQFGMSAFRDPFLAYQNMANGVAYNDTNLQTASQSMQSPLFLRSFRESNADIDRDRMAEFPPTVTGTKLSSTSTTGSLPLTDPIRPELRKILEIEQGNTLEGKFQYRWNINQFWTSVQNDNLWSGKTSLTSGDLKALQPYPRALTPHPVDPGVSAITGSAARPSTFAAGSEALQEYWARRDRQQMARDIYTLLYLLGGGQEPNAGNSYLDYAATSNASGTVYSAQQCREMAQFAVNVVDALDSDEVITKFEFQMDLPFLDTSTTPATPQGWTLDDNPFTDESTSVPSRAVVFGVETQSLCLNEGLVFKHGIVRDSGNQPTNHPATRLDDQLGQTPSVNEFRYFSYFELQNASPLAVSMSGNWQVSHRIAPTAMTAGTEMNCTIIGTTVLGGNSVVVGCRTHLSGDLDPSTSKPYPSYFEIDPDWYNGTTTVNIRPIIPASSLSATSGTGIDVDMVTGLGINCHLSDGSITYGNVYSDAAETNNTNAGAFLQNVTSTATQFTVVLKRRLHPSRTSPDISALTGAQYAAATADNPFVEVDRMTVKIKKLSIDDSNDALQDPNKTYGTGNAADQDIQPSLKRIASTERREPLNAIPNTRFPNNTDPAFSANPVGDTPAGRKYSWNTLGGLNYATQTMGSNSRYTLWQPHFNRDFASLAEFLAIPLYGPNLLTRKLSSTASGQSLGYAVPADFTDDGTAPITNIDGMSDDVAFPFRTAQAKFLAPAPTIDNDGNGTANQASDYNRWHRVLELMSITDRMHKQPDQNGRTLADYYMRSPVTPGKINLNTLRHRGVLHGLLDDPWYFEVADDATVMQDNLESTRNWFQQLITSRDAAYTAGGSTYLIPGAPGSKPFRALSYMGAPVTSEDPVQSTVLRSLPMDTARQLFSVGTNADNTSPGGASSVYADAYTRHRLLGKVMNNSTTRSHCFVCWIHVAYFEASENSSEDTNKNGKLDSGEDTNSNGMLDTFVQVGGKMTGVTDHRMMCIIDRSRIEKAYDTSTGRFTYRPLVVFQRIIPQ